MAVRSLYRYSRYVTLMKWLLSIGILVILGVSLGGPYFLSLINPAEPSDETETITLDNRMIHPRYTSTDSKGQPYEIKADRATQTTNDKPAHLTEPQGSLTLKKGETLTVKAKTGVYDPGTKRLDLGGGVKVTTTDGYKVQTLDAEVLIEKNIIQGSGPLDGKGPKGTLKSNQGFKIEHKAAGDKITLKGKSRVVLGAPGS